MAEVGDVGRRTPQDGVPVHLRAPAEIERLPVVRAVAETVAALGDFTRDEVADITLAVDEVCSQLVAVAVAVAGTELTCTFVLSEAGLSVTVGACLPPDEFPNREGFGWHVLETLTDSLSVSADTSDVAATGREVSVEFTKHGAGHTEV
jgi:serine/threonine-protein kinase RsbW